MLHRGWPAEGVTRVPYWVYQDEAVYKEEQEKIFRGATWNYLRDRIASLRHANIYEPQRYRHMTSPRDRPRTSW